MHWLRKTLDRLLSFVLPALGGGIPVALMLAYNYAIFRNPFASGYQYLVDPFFREGMSKGLMGIGIPSLNVLFYETIHPAQGIFWQSPILLLVFAGFFYLFRSKHYRLEGLIALIAFCAYLLLNAGYFLWWGGGSFAPRQMVPMLPFLCLPLIFVPRRLFPMVILLSFFSIFQMTIVAASTYNVIEDPYKNIAYLGYFNFSAIYSFCLKQLSDGTFAWNLGQVFGLRTWASLVPFTLVIGGGTIFMARKNTEK